ncbi:MAG TPA: ATP-binding cassette domain-containing protein [Xanthomonadaceae bacterium]|nr:ATP-binding cassette domain-containing protein [Xanthomonadaceae bacterium]
MAEVARIENLRFAWPRQALLLDLPELVLGAGERVFLRGPSGSGKSTLLGLLGGVLDPDEGRIVVLGQDLAALGRAGRDRFRGSHVGFIFQQFNLLPYLSLLENVLLPCRFSPERAARAGASEAERRAEARRLLDSLGLDVDELAGRPANELSVGQQQRVAAARALIGKPEMVIADEPTSALDADTRDGFIELLLAESARAGAAVLFVSHDAALERHFDRALSLDVINRAAHRKAA